MATRSQLRALHLCSGYGGFELGLRLAGVDAVTVCHVERDAYAAATLVARMAETQLDSAPIWDDLTTFDGEPWRGRVDIITAGFPCQPFSNAGAKKGIDDDRWLWPAIAGIVSSVGPRYVFLENVAGLIRAGLPLVLGDLADLGYDAEWGLFSAAEVGAPHKRERFWLLADADGEERAESIGTRDSGPDPKRGSVRARPRPKLGHPGSEGRPKEPRSLREYAGTNEPAEGPSELANGSGEDVADTDGPRPERLSGLAVTTTTQFGNATDSGGDTYGRWPPGREGDWPDYIAKGGPKPAVRRRTNGAPPELVESLHLGGNGLLPSVAGAAFIELRARLER